ncbi:MAG: cytochrome c3 family protein, partial [Actinomycetota bacterium]|nr:cytochrome c3 family protein [Actinomycetota bacterium]
MASNRVARTIVLAVVAFVSTAAFLAVPILPARSEVDAPPIDVTAPVTASNCTPCHAVIGASRNPRVLFNHASHLIADCSACHFTNPHEAGKTTTPPMSSCFTCHGLTHGPTGVIASGECIDCHPKKYPLRPVSHVKDWKVKPHATASKAGVNGCLLCHDPVTGCDTCHIKENVNVGPMPAIYLRTVGVKPDQPSVLVDPDAPVSMSQCGFCHPDIDTFKAGRIIFKHEDHLKRDYQCTACHPVFPHRPASVDKNSMRACYRCHGLEHGANGAVATEKCEACHPKEFKLTPADHTVTFLSGQHKERALADGGYCTMCHKASVCVKCHNGGTKLASGKTSLKVIPADHRKPQWSSQHGPLFLAQKGQCA